VVRKWKGRKGFFFPFKTVTYSCTGYSLVRNFLGVILGPSFNRGLLKLLEFRWPPKVKKFGEEIGISQKLPLFGAWKRS